ALAWGGGDPVGVAAPGVEERRLRGPGRLLRELDQLVLDLERAQGLELSKGHDVAHYGRLPVLVVSDSIFRRHTPTPNTEGRNERVAVKDSPESRLTVELLTGGPAVTRRTPRPKTKNRAGAAGSSLLASALHHDSRMMTIMPQIVSSVLPTA